MSICTIFGSLFADCPFYGPATRATAALMHEISIKDHLKELKNITVGGITAQELISYFAEEVIRSTSDIIFNPLTGITGNPHSSKIINAWKKLPKTEIASNTSQTCDEDFCSAFYGETFDTAVRIKQLMFKNLPITNANSILRS